MIHLDGKGFPVSNHSAQLNHRLHLRDRALNALVNQTLPERHTQISKIYILSIVKMSWYEHLKSLLNEPFGSCRIAALLSLGCYLK